MRMATEYKIVVTNRLNWGALDHALSAPQLSLLQLQHNIIIIHFNHISVSGWDSHRNGLMQLLAVAMSCFKSYSVSVVNSFYYYDGILFIYTSKIV